MSFVRAVSISAASSAICLRVFESIYVQKKMNQTILPILINQEYFLFCHELLK